MRTGKRLNIKDEQIRLTSFYCKWISAGTGLLSMMAAKALQETFPLCTLNADKPITACESFLPMFQLARKVISLNGLSSFVHLVHKRSDEMDMGSDMASQADILVKLACL